MAGESTRGNKYETNLEMEQEQIMQNSEAKWKRVFLRTRRPTARQGREVEVSFKTIKQNFQTIHSTHFWHLPHKWACPKLFRMMTPKP